MTAPQNWTNPTPLQRLEGLALLAAGVWIFAGAGHTWWLFGLLLLVPDLSMLGYLRSPAAGAVAYNLAHTLLCPAMLFAWSAFDGSSRLVAVAAIWLAHIGMDRVLGYGLKYPDSFRHTHLGTIGRAGSGPTPA